MTVVVIFLRGLENGFPSSNPTVGQRCGRILHALCPRPIGKTKTYIWKKCSRKKAETIEGCVTDHSRRDRGKQFLVLLHTMQSNKENICARLKVAKGEIT